MCVHVARVGTRDLAKIGTVGSDQARLGVIRSGAMRINRECSIKSNYYRRKQKTARQTVFYGIELLK